MQSKKKSFSSSNPPGSITANKNVNVPDIIAAKGQQKIAALTAYDYTFARLLDAAGIDVILVGDSLGCVVQGHTTTLPVTLEEMIYHCKCVTKGVERALVVGDLPFLSYQVSQETAVLSAGRLIKEGSVGAVKLEGGVNVSHIITALTAYDIPVMGHIGLTPQSYHRMGGHKLQGKSSESRKKIMQDALAVAEAGAFSIVLEGIPADLAQEITAAVSVPTIGIGAGTGCDGQILVSTDMLGLNPDRIPGFVRQYANLKDVVQSAVQNYVCELKQVEEPIAVNIN